MTGGFCFCQGLLFTGIKYEDEDRSEIIAFNPDDRLDLDRKSLSLVLDAPPVSLGSFENNLIVFGTHSKQILIIAPKILGT